MDFLMFHGFRLILGILQGSFSEFSDVYRAHSGFQVTEGIATGLKYPVVSWLSEPSFVDCRLLCLLAYTSVMSRGSRIHRFPNTLQHWSFNANNTEVFDIKSGSYLNTRTASQIRASSVVPAYIIMTTSILKERQTTDISSFRPLIIKIGRAPRETVGIRRVGVIAETSVGGTGAGCTFHDLWLLLQASDEGWLVPCTWLLKQFAS